MKQGLLSLALCGLFLLTACQSEAVQEEIWELEAEDVMVFADGQTVDRWRGYQDGLREPWALYELADGTVLLQEDDVSGPEDSAAYAALSEEVQAAVSAWYQGEGKRYQPGLLLAQCYMRWQEEGPSGAFEPGRVSQWAAATAASEEVVYLTTTVEEAADPANAHAIRYSAAFDRATGQRLDIWALFVQPEAQARLALAAAAGDDPDVQARLAAAIEPERIVFYGEHLEIDFPAGTFGELDSSYTLSVDYSALAGVLDARAVPAAGA